MQHRQSNPSSPNGDRWYVDQCKLDVQVTYQGTSGEPVTARPWLVMVMDEYTRMVVGFHLSMEPPTTDELQEFIKSRV